MRDTILLAALIAALLYAATVRGAEPGKPPAGDRTPGKANLGKDKPKPESNGHQGDFANRPKDGKLPLQDGQKPPKRNDKEGPHGKPFHGKLPKPVKR